MSLVAYEKLTSKDIRHRGIEFILCIKNHKEWYSTCMHVSGHAPCLLMPPSLTSHVSNKNMQKPDTKRHATWTSLTPVLRRVWHPRRTQPTHVRFEYSSLPWTWCVSPRSSEKWRTLLNDMIWCELVWCICTYICICWWNRPFTLKPLWTCQSLGGITIISSFHVDDSVIPKCQKCLRLTNTAVN